MKPFASPFARFAQNARRFGSAIALGLAAVAWASSSARAIAPPTFEWANLAGTLNDDWGRALAVDAAGNTYLAGSIDGTATFGSTNLTSSGGSNRPDIFVAKYSPAGQLLWVRKIGGAGTDLAFGIAVDNASNVIVTGSSDSTPFSIGSSSFNISGKKILFVKFDAGGGLLWVRTSLAQALFPPPDGLGRAVGADAAGNLYFAGQFTGPINFGGTAGVFPPPTGGIAFTNTAETDVFLLKYSPAGAAIWGRQIGGANLQEVRSLAVTPAGDVYMAGRFNGTTTVGTTTLVSGNTSWDTDAFLAKWSTAGDLQWVRQVTGVETDLGLAVAVDASGAPHLVGAFNGLNLNVGSTTYTNSDLSYDLFAAKYSSAGALLWSYRVERPAGILADVGLGAAIDANGNLLITGTTYPGARFQNVEFPAGTGGLFVALVENGDTVWVKRAGTIGGTFGGDIGAGIGQDASGNIYVGGTLARNEPATVAVFDSLTPGTYGQSDIFVAKIAGTLPPSGPAMNFTLTGGNLVMTWPLANADFRLECSPTIGGGFGLAPNPRVTNIVAQTISVTIVPSGGQKFYRLTRP